LQKRFGAKVVMGAPDWESTLQRPATAAGGVPTRDVVVGPAGMKLTLGDTTIDIVSTPGHTPGTLSYVFR
jgi:metallo-beta-lactamase class B